MSALCYLASFTHVCDIHPCYVQWHLFIFNDEFPWRGNITVHSSLLMTGIWVVSSQSCYLPWLLQCTSSHTHVDEFPLGMTESGAAESQDMLMFSFWKYCQWPDSFPEN
jgi:hypothetical protein